VDYQKLSALWDVLNGTDTILQKIQKAIMVKISMVKGKLPVSSIVFALKVLTQYGVMIAILSSDDEKISQPGMTTKRRNRGSARVDSWVAKPDS